MDQRIFIKIYPHFSFFAPLISLIKAVLPILGGRERKKGRRKIREAASRRYQQRRRGGSGVESDFGP